MQSYTHQPLQKPSQDAVRRRAVLLALTLTTLTGSGLAAEYLPLEVRTQLTGVSSPVVVYQQANDFSGYYPSLYEYGAYVTRLPDSPSVPPYFVSLDIPYYANYSQANGLTVRIYANDGPTVGSGSAAQPSPGTLLTSGSININSGYSLVSYSLPWSVLNTLPGSFTVSVQFAGQGSGNTAGWYTSQAATTVGSNTGYFFEKDASNNWQVAALVTPVPEASFSPVWALGLVGLGAIRRMRRAR
jgi:MYXO-CTERM domain-containing protein